MSGIHLPQIALNRLMLAALFLCLVSTTVSAFQLGAVTPGGGFVVFGRVSLPNGYPARRVKVFIEASNGLKRDTITSEEGNYEFRGLTTGRFRVYAVNPDAPEQYSDPAESDSTRAYSNRLQIDVHLRLPIRSDKTEAKPGTINVAEVAQDVPRPARQAYEKGLKFQKDNQPDKALESFSQAIELYPDYFQALTERGALLLQRSQIVEAATDFDHVMKINGKYAPALRGMGLCMLQSQHYPEAIELLSQAASLQPDEALTHMFLGFAQLSNKQARLAEASLQKALRLDATRAVRAHAYLADLYAGENRFLEAADELRAYLTAQPNASDAPRLKKMEAEWRARAAKK